MEKMLGKLKQLNMKVDVNLPLAAYSSFRIGGNADLALFPASRKQLMEALSVVREGDAPVLVVGNASNVVFSDNGYRGVIIFTTEYREACVGNGNIRVGAGALISAASAMARDASLQGLEFAYGIPGTVGGAVFMNAGAFGGSMADVCIQSEYYDMETGECGVLAGDAQDFSYRTSTYEKNPSRVILGATLQLKNGDREEIRRTMKDFMERRKTTQPLEYPSAGSVFKRPSGHFAGKLIEDCGLKGLRIGGAEVSQKHAGFIVNRGGATAGDVRALVETIRERVLCETGVVLECEIRFL